MTERATPFPDRTPSWAGPVTTAALAGTTDEALERLLRAVYVGEGYTPPELAIPMLAADAVRARGEVLVARDEPTGTLLGVVVFVEPSSPGRRLATGDDAELHLLAVDPEARGRGIGRALVDAAVARAAAAGHSGIVLWTQTTMHAAQRLYERAGFGRRPELDYSSNGRRFLVLRRALAAAPSPDALVLTQLVWVHPGKEAVFEAFEAAVLPLLAEHGGRLLLRVRPNAPSVLAAEPEAPYEVHVLSFEREEGLAAFTADERRARLLPLKDEAVRRSWLFRGRVG